MGIRGFLLFHWVISSHSFFFPLQHHTLHDNEADEVPSRHENSAAEVSWIILKEYTVLRPMKQQNGVNIPEHLGRHKGTVLPTSGFSLEQRHTVLRQTYPSLR